MLPVINSDTGIRQLFRYSWYVYSGLVSGSQHSSLSDEVFSSVRESGKMAACETECHTVYDSCYIY